MIDVDTHPTHPKADLAFNDATETAATVGKLRAFRDHLELMAWTEYAAGSPERTAAIGICGDLVTAIIVLKNLQDEVTYWRQDAAARMRTAVTLARAADKAGDHDRAAHISVGIIFPTRAALANALSGDLYYPLCGGCSKPVEDGDIVFAVGDGYGKTGEAHVDCGRPKLDGHGGDGEALPEEAYLYASDPENSPEGIAHALAEANAYCEER